MITRHFAAAFLLAGIALGATAVEGLRAQGKPPVYVVAVFTEITDPGGTSRFVR
jgi:hypothetical protein